MKYGSKNSWTQNPIRRVASLFITVIWLATVLQPCVMASVVDSDSANVETHHASHADDLSSHGNHGASSGNHGCPHCDTSGDDKNHCKSETSKICDNEDSYVYSGRIKSVDHEKFHDQHQPTKLLDNSDNGTQTGQLVASEIGKSPLLFQGPKLADLYRVYLK
ncbi:MAG: hypothetical protein QNK19_03065 [Xanthomonadales bacterium]|nr:hypothetical protein [Xanthomonadales bacterium]